MTEGKEGIIQRNRRVNRLDEEWMKINKEVIKADE
jgi:hypothetical protein